MADRLRFDEDTHSYFLDGEKVPSVTEICGVLTAGDMAQLSPFMLDNAARRGTRVHEITQLIDYGVPLEDIELEPEIIGYVSAYLKFLRDYRPQWEMIEQPVYNRLFKYAGTLDRYGTIDGKTTIADIKTTASPNRLTKIAWAAQTAGYALAEQFDDFPVQRLIIQLKADGKYTVHDCRKTEDKYGVNGMDTFIECLHINKIIGDYK